MKILEEEAYNSLTENTRLLEADKHGPKVLLTNDGKICKLFRCKRTFSSAKLYPYAQRFADNAKLLIEKGIPSVDLIGVYRIPHLDRDMVVYNFLNGNTLRNVLQKQYSSDLIHKTACFIARIHDMGVYFRSLHFGNIIILENGEFGLIDVSDMKIKPKSLGVGKRVRNFKAVMRYKEDMEFINEFNFKKFIDVYIDEAGLSRKMFNFSLKLQPNHPAAPLLLKS